MTVPVDETLDAPFARLDDDAARSIGETRYGLDVREVRRLDTERDDTFRLTTPGCHLVLKVANPADDPALVDLQCAALRHLELHAPGLAVPRVVVDRDGASHCVVAGSAGEPRTVRLLTWVAGRSLDYAATSPGQRRDVGRAVATLSAGLAGFEHDAADRVLAWDLQRLTSLRPQLAHVVDAPTRALVGAELDRFDGTTAPRLARVRHQVVHNDVNADNVVVDQHGDVVGVLDFGDIVRTAVVADLAVAMAYAVGTGGSDVDGDHDPWAAPYDLATGYVEVRPLDDDEVGLLPDLVRGRLAQRLLVNSWLAARDPANAHYTARSVHVAAAALRALASAAPPSGDLAAAGPRP